MKMKHRYQIIIILDNQLILNHINSHQIKQLIKNYNQVVVTVICLIKIIYIKLVLIYLSHRLLVISHIKRSHLSQ
jgi:hypothetical protein